MVVAHVMRPAHRGAATIDELHPLFLVAVEAESGCDFDSDL
jgi:hypothetical protein